MQRGPVREIELLHGRAHRLADLAGADSFRVRQQQAELLAAIAAREAEVFRRNCRQRLAEPGQAGITLGVAVGVVVELEMIDIDHQKRQLRAILPGLHPFIFQPALETAPVGEAGEHVDGGHHGEAVVGGEQFALALAEPRRHGVEGAGQRHEFRWQAFSAGACRPVALAKALGGAGQDVDRLDDERFGRDQRAQQHEQADKAELQIGGADIAVDRRGRLLLVIGDDQARAGAGDARKADGALGAVSRREGKRSFVLARGQRRLGDR